ncbi:glycosyltransferase family 2 protein [Myxococcota bacterium]|nr:glycosyltransferase family 2 protein [Myxococcota bacterium]MBU1898858.1 glycosyltransferase family 2 protein [Myxococcota bacterium]
MTRAVAVVIATKNRPDLLVRRAISSIARQTQQPARIVIVNDGHELPTETRAAIRRALPELAITISRNARRTGAGGAWNTALAHLKRSGFAGFVALLDDDDEWTPEHLSANLDAVKDGHKNVAISGLRLLKEGVEIPRPLITTLAASDFLVSNPGWQGSNTFVELTHFLAVGGFRESLRSAHDRDLAIRLLDHPATRIALVPRWTATWHLGTPGCLSQAGSEAKLQGLCEFWRLYHPRMKTKERVDFIERAVDLFGARRAMFSSSIRSAHEQG